MIRATLLALALAVPLGAAAQEGGQVAVTFGAGIGTAPTYFGSDSSKLGPAFSFSVQRLRLGDLSFGNPDGDAVPQGFGFRGSFRYVSERSAEEDPELAGLEDIDTTYEVGGGLSYSQPWWEAFAVARFGLGGHEAVTGEVGMDLIARPRAGLTLRAGPRLSLGSDDFAATYFGVTDAEAAASAFPAYEADGGLVSSGLQIGATWQVTEAWGFDAIARYDRLQDDAAASPITPDDDQLSVSLTITRRVDFSF